MNTYPIKAAIKKLIWDNGDTLVTDLYQGTERLVIQQITTTELTNAFSSGITMSVVCRKWSEVCRAAVVGGNSVSYANAKTVKVAEYDIEVAINMMAHVSPGEDGDYVQPFEEDQALFDLFVARVVELFRDSETITPVSGSYVIEIVPKEGREYDRRIDGESQTGFREDDGDNIYALLREVLRFKVQTCGAPSPNA